MPKDSKETVPSKAGKCVINMNIIIYIHEESWIMNRVQRPFGLACAGTFKGVLGN